MSRHRAESVDLVGAVVLAQLVSHERVQLFVERPDFLVQLGDFLLERGGLERPQPQVFPALDLWIICT